MRFENQKFSKQRVILDFNEFHQCEFEGCTMLFHGFGPVAMDRCRFVDVQWTFSGAAATTLTFLTALYKGAGNSGKAVVEEAFKDIRGGSLKYA